MSGSSLKASNHDYMPALLAYLDRIAKAQEDTASALNQVAVILDSLGDDLARLSRVLEDISEEIDPSNDF